MLTLHRMLAALAALTMAAFLAGCGGDSGAGAYGPPGSAEGGGPAALDLKTSEPSIGSDGRTLATITASVKDSSNRALANQTVDFSTTDAGSILRVVSGRTDASGVATATLEISDQTNRNITVTAVSGQLTKTVNVAVIGTTVTVSGPSSLIANAPTEFTVSVRDSSGAVLAGKPVKITSSAGNTLSASTVTTNSAGQAKFTLTGTKAGADRVEASSLGATGSIDVQVSATQVSFTAPSAGQEIVVSTPQPVTITYTLGGVAQPGQTIQFSTTRGTLSASSAVTGSNGQASVTLSSPTAGSATVTAIAGSVVSSQRIEFVSRTPAKLTLQASPANVGVNLTTSSNNSSQLIAVVRDAADNPVKGQTVAFSAVSDPSNGRIEPAIATTDSAGVATVAFYPGANSSGFNQIVMKAAIPGTSVSGTTSLTASKQELVVRIGTGNAIADLDVATYSMPWSVIVSDASGNPVNGASVQASLLAVAFRKGYYVLDRSVDPPIWVPVYADANRCESEDTNRNLRLDAGEDLNGDGQLTPGNVAVAVVASAGGTTDQNGLAAVNVIYPKEFGNFTYVQLRVTITTIAGTEGAATREFLLPISVADASKALAPFGGVSPYGREPGCDNTR